jgi:antitoxin (DNA-binding transcriptional repressor) of toxin-antitoxin stability system
MTLGEARAAFPAVVDRVLAGEEITITRHGVPVAVVVRPTDPAAALVVSPGDRVQVLAGAALDQVGGAEEPARVVVAEALVLTAPGRAAGADNPPGSAGGGLLGAFGPEGSASDRTGADDGGAPAGVLVLAVRPGDVLELAAVTGIRTLTVARQFSMSS